MLSRTPRRRASPTELSGRAEERRQSCPRRGRLGPSLQVFSKPHPVPRRQAVPGSPRAREVHGRQAVPTDGGSPLRTEAPGGRELRVPFAGHSGVVNAQPSGGWDQGPRSASKVRCVGPEKPLPLF